MMPVRLCFENKKTLSFSYAQERNYSNRFEFWILPTYFDGTLRVYISLCQQKYNISVF